MMRNKRKIFKYRYIIEGLSLIILISIGFLIYNIYKPIQISTFTKPDPSATYKVERVEKFDIPILMYHYIRIADIDDQAGRKLSVSPDNFENQIKYLTDNNYQTVKLEDLSDPNLENISKVYANNKKPIVLTFDDGYADAYQNAFPILKKYNTIGTFFIIKNYIGKSNYMDADQISEMKRTGMDFGSHTLSHPDLTKINTDDAKIQISESKDNYTIFCYPSGRFDDNIIQLVKDAGYKSAVTTKIGIARENSDLFKLPRVRIEDVSIQDFADKISYAYEHGTN